MVDRMQSHIDWLVKIYGISRPEAAERARGPRRPIFRSSRQSTRVGGRSNVRWKRIRLAVTLLGSASRTKLGASIEPVCCRQSFSSAD